MTTVDWVVLGIIVVSAWVGLRSGFIGGLMALVGFAGGAFAAAWLAPQLLPAGRESAYAPLFALCGAAIGGAVFSSLLERVGSSIRKLLPIPFLGKADRFFGAGLGAVVGVGVVWLGAIVIVALPGAEAARTQLRRSPLIQALGAVMPPTAEVLGVVGRFDPLPVVGGAAGIGLSAPDREVLALPQVRSASGSVVRIRAESCGFAVEGSGWVASPGLVVTNAHVVAGDPEPSVEPRGKGLGLDARVVVFDRVNDLAVLSVRGLRLPGILTSAPQSGSAGAVLGYPLNGGFNASPVTVGRTVAVLGDDAYGNGPVGRTVVALRGLVRPGNSGGPVINNHGEAVATVYGKTDRGGGFAVPIEVSRKAVARAIYGASDPMGPCTR